MTGITTGTLGGDLVIIACIATIIAFSIMPTTDKERT